MNKLKLNNKVIIRSPRFSYEAKLKDCWLELKTLIKEASPEFYEVIKKLTFDQLIASDYRLQNTVNKYFNRSKFRSTPFGSFASVCITEFSDSPETLLLEDSVIMHKFQSWRNRNLNPEIAHDDYTKGDLKFFANTTFYRVGQEIRFICKEDSSFLVNSVDFDPDIEQILTYCCRPRTFVELEKHFNSIGKNSLLNMLKDMVAIKMLLTSRHSNIIGEDYLARINAPVNPGVQPYIISERKVLSKGINKSLFRHLPALATKMHELSIAFSNESLNIFKSRFMKKFEGLEIPLLIALDPEVGVGYGDLAIRNGQSIRETFRDPRDEAQKGDSVHEWNDLSKIIIDAINKKTAIKLDSIKSEVDNKDPLPNTIGVLCTAVDEKIYLESMGGVTSNAMAGRFAFAVPEILEHCREMAKLETMSNPDVLFFDIGYSHEQAADDVNRRPSIYPQQLNILNYDISLRPIPINDIMVSIRNDCIVLRSLSLNKRIIPRFASAYNYKRSDLSLFRFLMDIQGQGLCTNLMLRPINLIPGLRYYPSIEFRNIITSPEMWLLEDDILKDCLSHEDMIAKLDAFLKDNIGNRYVKVFEMDQSLFINRNDKSDLRLLLSILKKVKSLYLEESRLPQSPNTFNSSGSPLLPQFNLTLQHTDQVYNKVTFLNTEDKQIESRQWLAPGKEWLYFEIFGDPYRLEVIMQEKIPLYLKRNRHGIDKWFFIRHNENGEHLRLRFKLKYPNEGYLYIAELSKLLKPELEDGFISDLLIRTYKREVHRYSSELMDQVEQHFTEDTNFVISVMNCGLSELQKCKLILKVISAVRSEEIFTGLQFEEMINRMVRSFNSEFKIQTKDFKEINKLYHSLQREPVPMLPKIAQAFLKKLLASYCALVGLADKTIRAQLFADLLHMHVNRLFVTDQRFMELLVYNFAQIDLWSERKRKASLQGSEIRA